MWRSLKGFNELLDTEVIQVAIRRILELSDNMALWKFELNLPDSIVDILQQSAGELPCSVVEGIGVKGESHSNLFSFTW